SLGPGPRMGRASSARAPIRLGKRPFGDSVTTNRPTRLGADMKLVRIREAKPLEGHRVQLTLTDGRVIERDLGPMLTGPVFSEIRSDQERFRQMLVEGGTLVWPNGADLC